jgi:hypothetical protein
MRLRRFLSPACVTGAACIVAACSGGGNAPMSSHAVPPLSVNNGSVLATLTNQQTIGSTSPSTPADVNPYGLDIEKAASGKISAGDLVVCDFNNPGNVQGTGTEIVALHPVVGSTPTLIAKSNTLTGCNAIATAPNGNVWAAAFKANDNPIFTGSGTLVSALSNGPWNHPFGEAFVPANAALNHPAFYVSNAGDGSLVRVTILPGPAFTFTSVATGFPVNGGKPGSILAPSGLNYQSNGDILYIVDGTNNTLYAIQHISSVPANGIAVNANGTSFTGSAGNDASVVFSGPPLNGPISSAILYNGNIVLGNTLDPDGQNLMVEVSPGGSLLDVKNVDTGPAGALFGMVASGTSAATTKLYFNDDNDNTVEVLTP